MPANYLVLINERLADIRNFPELGGIVLKEAAFFWRKPAFEYQQFLITKLPTALRVELRKI